MISNTSNYAASLSEQNNDDNNNPSSSSPIFTYGTLISGQDWNDESDSDQYDSSTIESSADDEDMDEYDRQLSLAALGRNLLNIGNDGPEFGNDNSSGRLITDPEINDTVNSDCDEVDEQDEVNQFIIQCRENGNERSWLYRCIICDGIYPSARALNMHKVYTHQDTNDFICSDEKCDFATSSYDRFNIHRIANNAQISSTMTPLSSSSILPVISASKSRQIISAQIPTESEISYLCEFEDCPSKLILCEGYLGTVYWRNKHEDIYHYGSIPLKHYPVNPLSIAAFRQNNQMNCWHCVNEDCGQVSHIAYLRNQHMVIAHNDVNNYVCSNGECDFATFTFEAFQDHQNLQHRSVSQPSLQPPSITGNYYLCQLYPCAFRLIACGGAVTDTHWLNEHQSLYHPSISNTNFVPLDPAYVKLLFSQSRRVYDNMQCPFRCLEIVCPIRSLQCHIGFSSAYLLNVHRVEMHRCTNTFICARPGCDFASRLCEALHEHQLTHIAQPIPLPQPIIPRPIFSHSTWFNTGYISHPWYYNEFPIETLDVLTITANCSKIEDEIRYALLADSSQQCYVYSLSLWNSNYYVGESRKFTQRMRDHFTGKGAVWTKKHLPVAINYVQACVNKQSALIEEENLFLRMVSKYGAEHVKGARWC